MRFKCSDCDHTITATVTGQHDVPVRHTREETVATPIIEAPEFGEAVTQHRRRGCPARQFREVPDAE
jgi:hypothetical protein